MGKTTVSGTANDYEVASQFSVVSGGNYTHFLRGSATTIEEGAGSYISVVLNVDAYTGSPSSVGATLEVYKCVNGTTTGLGGMNVGVVVGSPNTLRAVVWGTTLIVYLNGQFAVDIAVPAATGTTYAGVGASGTTPGAFVSVAIGHHDITVPNAIASEPVASSVFPKSVSLAWPNTTDDSAGIGLFLYVIYRNGTYFSESPISEFTDGTAQPGTTYMYTIYADDQHGNRGPGLTLSVTTPPAGNIDPRRIGVQKNGSYWGGGGEQIDTLSGNVNFSIPTISPQLRSGQKIALGLSYNSQNWRQDSGYNWQLGNDTGYGFGWTMQFGSLTPYYNEFYAPVDHYVFTDNTGAQYQLNVNNNNVWSSSQSVYVWFDATANRLHFANGSFWVMGCTSGGIEADFGTMYPTTIEDSNGNQIVVQYNPGAWPPTSGYNSSSRINTVTDFTGTYNFSYTNYSITNFTTTDGQNTPLPHLTGITAPSGIPADFTLTYPSQPANLEPAFGSDARYLGATTMQLASVTPPIGNAYSFTYDLSQQGMSVPVQKCP